MKEKLVRGDRHYQFTLDLGETWSSLYKDLFGNMNQEFLNTHTHTHTHTRSIDISIKPEILLLII